MNGIVPILRRPGIDLVGPLPAEVQSHSLFVAGVGAATKEKAAATALVTFLTSRAAVAVFRKHGVEAVP
jgi:molybdate transport system substrate-binding protein